MSMQYITKNNINKYLTVTVRHDFVFYNNVTTV